MFKKLEELLEAGTISKEAAEAIDVEITNVVKDLRDEAAKHRTKLKETEEAYKAKLEEQRAELEAKIEEAKKAGESEVAAKFEEKLKAITAEKEELAAKTQRAIIDSAVNRAIAEKNVTDPDLARLYIEKHLALDGDEVFVTVGDEKLTFSNGVEKLFEAKPSLLASSGTPGSGAGGGGGSGGTKIPTRKEFLAMSPAEQAALRAENPNILNELKEG